MDILALVDHITQKFILPTLSPYLSDVAYMGSNYEYTRVPGTSDFDIQGFVKLPHEKKNGAKIFSSVAEKCDNKAWRMVKGGPKELLNKKGYLSTTEVCINKLY